MEGWAIKIGTRLDLVITNWYMGPAVISHVGFPGNRMGKPYLTGLREDWP